MTCFYCGAVADETFMSDLSIHTACALALVTNLRRMSEDPNWSTAERVEAAQRAEIFITQLIERGT